MFDGKVFRSVYKLGKVETDLLSAYFDKLLKECHTKEDFCKHCTFDTNGEKPYFFSPCNFCLDLEHMQFQPLYYDYYKVNEAGAGTLLVN